MSSLPEGIDFFFKHVQTDCARQFSGPLIVAGGDWRIEMGIATADYRYGWEVASEDSS
jgi:hypothetical protein